MHALGSSAPAAPPSNNATVSVGFGLVPHQMKTALAIDSDAALLPHSIHQLGSAHEWSNVWTGPYLAQTSMC